MFSVNQKGKLSFRAILLGLALVLVSSAAVAVIVNHGQPAGQWQEFQTNYNPVVAVFNLTVEGAKSAVRIDPASGQVGFGAKSFKDESLQIFSKMKDGVFQNPLTEGNKIKWQEVLPGIDVELHTFDGSVKEFIHIKNDRAAHRFEFDLEKALGVSEEIDLRDDSGITVTVLNKKTGEEFFTLDYPIAIDANGKYLYYHYRLEDSNPIYGGQGENAPEGAMKNKGGNKLILEPHDPRHLASVVYPLILDPPMTVREYDEVLVKIGQNGNESGNAKDGDVVMIKPMGWHWGKEEYKDYVVVRVPKMTEEERQEFMRRFTPPELSANTPNEVSNPELSSNDNELISNDSGIIRDNSGKIRENLEGAHIWGIDYVSLLENPQVKALEIDVNGLARTEKEISKNGLLEMIRNRVQQNPILDASQLSLEEIFKKKDWAVAVEDRKHPSARFARSGQAKTQDLTYFGVVKEDQIDHNQQDSTHNNIEGGIYHSDSNLISSTRSFSSNYKQDPESSGCQGKDNCQEISSIHKSDDLFFGFYINNGKKDSYEYGQDVKNNNTLGNLVSYHKSDSLESKSDKYRKNNVDITPIKEFNNLIANGQEEMVWLIATPKNNPLAISQKKLDSTLDWLLDNVSIIYPQHNYSTPLTEEQIENLLTNLSDESIIPQEKRLATRLSVGKLGRSKK